MTTTSGCPNVMAITALLFLFALSETFQLFDTVSEYLHRDEEYEKIPRRSDEWRVWTRGYQVSHDILTFTTLMMRVQHPLTHTPSQFLCTFASAVLATFLFIPFSPGISVVNDVRGKFAWLLVLGAVICGILSFWHLLLCPGFLRQKLHQVYWRYIFFIVMEVFVAVASMGFCSVSLRPPTAPPFTPLQVKVTG